MAWLSGWAKRVKLTIDQTDIDAALENFPILLYLSTTSGYNAEDISFIFDELTLDANRFKIAVTKSDGTTECYVEIEKWDDANEKAWLWVKAPTIAADADTDLYLYYDSTHADNTTYVGDPNSVPAETVWDANFVFVSHMADDPGTSNIRDSSTNDNDGAKTAAGEPAVSTSGKVANAQNYDGVDDHIHIAQNATLDFTTSYTLEGWFYPDQIRQYEVLFARGAGNADDIEAYIQTATSFVIAHNRGNGGTFSYEQTWTNPVALTWTHIAIVWASLRWTLYHDGIQKNTSAVDRVNPLDTDKGWIIGDTEATAFGATKEFDGLIDEVRFSNTNRSVAWLKATYETGRDHLLDWGSEETSGTAWTLFPVDSLAITDAISKGFGARRTETVALADNRAGTSEFKRSYLDSVAIADLLDRTVDYIRTNSDTLSIAETLAKTIGVTKSDTLVIADILSLAVSLSKVDSVALADALTKTIALSKSDTVTIADLARAGIFKALSDTVTISDSEALTYNKSLADGVSLIDALVKTFGLTEADTITLTDSFTKLLGMSKSDAVSLSDALGKAFITVKGDSISISDLLAKAVAYKRSMADVIALTDALSKLAGLTKTDTIAVTDSLSKKVSLIKAEALAITETLAKRFSLSLADTLEIYELIYKLLIIRYGINPVEAWSIAITAGGRYGSS